MTSYDEKTHWHAGATYEVTLELHLSKAKVLQYLRDQTCIPSLGNSRSQHRQKFFKKSEEGVPALDSCSCKL